ncbi:hypothetical protein [Aliikangiella maris]|uniref:Viral coat protein P2 N-terminal domain-containing protein n=2 Tax=Aliikangiella maris TaxID=3162458 RepID=A0ABV3MKJ1_9GAMM
MSVRFDDPLMHNIPPDRVNYENGVLLDEVDFKAEQTYHRGRLSRLLAYLHGSGTVAGLKVREKPDDITTLVIEPGLAIDRLGRMIEVPQNYCLNIADWFNAQLQSSLGLTRMSQAFREADGEIPAGIVVDLFIKFAICERGKTPAFSHGNQEVTDAFTFARMRDAFKLELRIRDDGIENIPVPNKGIADLTGNSKLQRKSAVENFKLDFGWRENTQWSTIDGQLNKDQEHLQDQDGSEVFLARLRIPATTEPVTYNDSLSIHFDNQLRRFVYSTHELSWIQQAGE